MWPPVVVECVIMFIFAVLVHKYYSPIFKHRWYVPITVIVGFFFSFFIVVLVPTDVVSTEYDMCHKDCSKPFVYISNDALSYIWKILYWVTYVMCWTIYPLLQSYCMAAGFTVFDRVKRALIENVLFYGIAGVFGGIILLYIGIIRGMSWENIEATAIGASNCWGFLLVMLFFGYGLVAIPRVIWRRANLNQQLRYLSYQVISFRDDMHEAKVELKKNMKLVRKLDMELTDSSPFRYYLENVINSCPEAYEDIKTGEGSIDVTYKNLLKLKSKMKSGRHTYKRNQWLYDRCLRRAFAIEDILNAKRSDIKFKVEWSFSTPRQHYFSTSFNAIEWIWKLYIMVWFYRLMAVCCTLLSISLLWSECTFFTDAINGLPDLSIWGQIVNAKHLEENFWKPVIILIPLTYMVVCTYWSLFRFRLFNYYRLIPHHTEAASLLFAALYLCRLIAPLVYNFIGVIGTTDTAFYQFMGVMDSIPGLGHFNRYLPIALVVIAVATLFEIFTRIALILNIRRFQFDSGWSNSQIDEGESLIQQQRTIRLKKFSSGFDEFGSSSGTNRSDKVLGVSTSYSRSIRGLKRASSLQLIKAEGNRERIGRYSLDLEDDINFSSTTTSQGSSWKSKVNHFLGITPKNTTSTHSHSSQQEGIEMHVNSSNRRTEGMHDINEGSDDYEVPDTIQLNLDVESNFSSGSSGSKVYSKWMTPDEDEL